MTAVEFLIDKLHKRWYGLEEGDTWNDLIQQALIMEKEQILKAYDKGYDDVDVYEPEKYFNETYKKDNHDHRSTKPTI